MNHSRKIMIAGLTGIAMGVAGFSATGLGGIARADAGHDAVAERIAVAFAAVPATQADPALLAAAAGPQKGDLLVAPPCSGQQWPDVQATCLVSADGSAVRPVRHVTIGYQTGEASSVLIRMPAPQIASN